ncbi:MAG: hypothetical protein HQ580_10700 [Planctomycetes bacterium]|nr:hypothetical protein [Planctomycetota bacterium]
MPDREEIIQREQTAIQNALVEQYGDDLIVYPFLHHVIEEATPLELMRSHDTTAGPCHKDYVITRRDYRMKLVFMFAVRTPNGIQTAQATSTEWFEIQGEQKLTTEWHCEPGAEDLPKLPEDYCMLKFGDTVVWSGNANCSITINFGGKSSNYQIPRHDTEVLLNKRYAIEKLSTEAPKVI